MKDPDDVYEPERKKISLWLIVLLSLAPVVIGIFIVVVMAWPSSQAVKSPPQPIM